MKLDFDFFFSVGGRWTVVVVHECAVKTRFQIYLLYSHSKIEHYSNKPFMVHNIFFKKNSGNNVRSSNKEKSASSSKNRNVTPCCKIFTIQKWIAFFRQKKKCGIFEVFQPRHEPTPVLSILEVSPLWAWPFLKDNLSWELMVKGSNPKICRFHRSKIVTSKI